jgi:hypothetical protein
MRVRLAPCGARELEIFHAHDGDRGLVKTAPSQTSARVILVGRFRNR